MNGEQAASMRKANLAHTVVGYATHHAATVFWAVFFERWVGARRPSAVLPLLRDAGVMSAVAAAVDYGVTPKRFTPGWEFVLSKRSMAAAYAAMALGLVGGLDQPTRCLANCVGFSEAFWAGCVLADAGYGARAEFRHGLDARGLRWAVGIARNQKVCDRDVQLVPPSGRARKPSRKRMRFGEAPDQEPQTAEDVLAALPWRRVTWRRGAKEPLAAKFAAIRVRVGDGLVWRSNRHLPGKEAWLVGEWRSSGARKYRLSNLAPRTSMRALAAAVKARWVCEQAHQQLKGELGLGHFEGRSWTGPHRHALMCCIAYAHLQHPRLAGQLRTGLGENAPPRAGTKHLAPSGGNNGGQVTPSALVSPTQLNADRP